MCRLVAVQQNDLYVILSTSEQICFHSKQDVHLT